MNYPYVRMLDAKYKFDHKHGIDPYAVSDSSAGSERPNFALRRAVALGSAVLLGLGVAAFVRGQHDIDVVQALQQPASGIKADIDSGKINKKDVSVVIATETLPASVEAARVVSNDRDARDTQADIVAQTGDVVETGDPLALADSQLKTEYQGNPPK